MEEIKPRENRCMILFNPGKKLSYICNHNTITEKDICVYFSNHKEEKNPEEDTKFEKTHPCKYRAKESICRSLITRTNSLYRLTDKLMSGEVD